MNTETAIDIAFTKIHDVYESHDGGSVNLSDDEVATIKGAIESVIDNELDSIIESAAGDDMVKPDFSELNAVFPEHVTARVVSEDDTEFIAVVDNRDGTYYMISPVAQNELGLLSVAESWRTYFRECEDLGLNTGMSTESLTDMENVIDIILDFYHADTE